MTLRNWITNDEALVKCWQRKDLNIQEKHATISLGCNLTKVLGLPLKTEENFLTFEAKILIEFVSSQKSSKRLLLEADVKTFNPLGMLTPLTIRIQCVFQELKLKKTPWDRQSPINAQVVKMVRLTSRFSRNKKPEEHFYLLKSSNSCRHTRLFRCQ